MMMCIDLMCTQKLTSSQLSLADSAEVKTDMLEKNEKKQLESVDDGVSRGGEGWKGRRTIID